MLQIRKIKPEDIQFVLELAKENNCLEGKLLSNIESFLICESDNLKCGCGCLVPVDNIGLMSWVMVAETHRRNKLGGAIVKALLNIADISGIKEVYAAALPTALPKALPMALPKGVCGEFLSAMGFEKNSSSWIKDKIYEALGVASTECYSVSLEGYFKPCSQK